MSMKYRRLVRIISLCLCCIMLVGCANAQQAHSEPTEKLPDMEPEESYALSYDIAGGKDVMPIAGFYGPYPIKYSKDGCTMPNYISEEYFQMIADAGVNVISASSLNYASTPELLIQTLELGEKYGVGIYVTDDRVTANINDDTYTAQEASKHIADYYDYPAFCGLVLVDEPTWQPHYNAGDGKRDISLYGHLANILRNDLGVRFYNSMYSILKWDDATREAYTKYVQEIGNVMNPYYVTCSFYPFSADQPGGLPAYFFALDLMQRQARSKQVPFWAYIQAGSQWNDSGKRFDSESYFPNEAEFNWNVNTALAFGAQGITYFPLIQPYHFAYAKSTDWDFQRNGIIGAWGNKTRWYYYAQNISKQIQEIDEVLMNAVNKGVIVNGKQAVEDTGFAECIIKEGTFRELASVSGDAMVGCFNYQGKSAFYVVNYSMEYAQHISLDFNGTQNMKVIQNAETSHVKTDNLTLDMAAGEGILIVIE